MKPSMILAIVLLTAIVLMTSFDLALMPTKPIQLSEQMAAGALFVCPVESSVWDTISNAMKLFLTPIKIGFLFATIVLIFVWAWAMYQNLLKDKFVRDAFKNPWAYTKLLFWAGIVMIMLIMTPNHFRTVHLINHPGEWILCEDNTPGAKAVHANMVTR